MPKERFIAPGTWTCPPTVTYVRVFVVGGGGGGGAGNFAPFVTRNGGGGGGGRVREEHFVPVSGPVPITVGAGGTAGVATFPQPAPNIQHGGQGGTSAFGPLGPGPIPAIPPTTIAAGGGGGGLGGTNPANFQPNMDAPPIGGSGGASGTPLNGRQGFASFGTGGGYYAGGGATQSTQLSPISYSFATGDGFYGGGGANGGAIYGYGARAGQSVFTPPGAYFATSARANFGGGGAGGTSALNGSAGGSGIVIVEYFQ